jgi:hypothetical protein
MSLDVDWSKVKDKTKVRDSQGNLDPKAHAIAFRTMAVGMGEITQKNYKEFYRRCWMVEAVHATAEEHRLTLEDVQGLIGMRTNVWPAWSRKKFDGIVARQALERAVNFRRTEEEKTSDG